MSKPLAHCSLLVCVLAQSDMTNDYKLTLTFKNRNGLNCLQICPKKVFSCIILHLHLSPIALIKIIYNFTEKKNE